MTCLWSMLCRCRSNPLISVKQDRGGEPASLFRRLLPLTDCVCSLPSPPLIVDQATLDSTAAFATAAALCAARIWPWAGSLAIALAVLWTGLVAVSRLVLGVPRPSDVLVAVSAAVLKSMLHRPRLRLNSFCSSL